MRTEILIFHDTFPGWDLPRVEADEAHAWYARGHSHRKPSVGRNLLGKTENMRIW